MLKLMKYEFRKTQATKLMILAITAIAEVAFLIGLYGKHDTTAALSIAALVFLATFGILIVGLESIVTLHRDMNTKQSYMLFMTPNSSYKILGSKVLECSLSILIAGAFFFALGTLDITLAFAKEVGLKSLWETIQDVLRNISINGRPLEINARALASFTFTLLTSWILTLTTAYLSIVISAALLNGKRFNGFVSFIFFLLLNWGCTKVLRLATSHVPTSTSVSIPLLVSCCVALVLSVIMYIITAQIMERKLSV
ncbi:MAG: hypothetical protein IJ917_08960 [Firmicutes bacterium]|nr:hypothetical protein [Bacillota bacterium]